jgi:iron complex outermembrane recepter protein
MGASGEDDSMKCINKSARSHLLPSLMGATALAFGMVGIPSAAFAQAAPAAEEDGVGLDTIIVTARKTSENVQDVPVSVTAFSGAQLQAQGAARVEDLARFTPGLTLVGSPANTNAAIFAVRGQAQTDVLATLEPSVGVYLDGLYIARTPGINGDLLDIASVQTLKGPQGTLFGKNTSAGAILFETNKPKLNETSLALTATYGRFNQIDGSAIVNIPLVTDKLAFRGAVQQRHRDGIYHDIVNGKNYNNIANYSGRAKLLWEPTPDISIVATGDWSNYKSNGPVENITYISPGPNAASAATAIQSGNPGVGPAIGAVFSCIVGRPAPLPAGTPVGCGIPGLAGNFGLVGSAAIAGLRAFGVTVNPLTGVGAPPTGLGLLSQPLIQTYIDLANNNPRNVSLNANPLTKTNTQTYSLALAVDQSFGTFKLIGGYRKVTSLSRVDLDGTPFTLLHTTGRQNLHQWSIEGQLAGKVLEDKLNYVVGATYFTEAGVDQSTSENALGIAPALSGGASTDTTGRNFGIIDNKSYGIYAQGTYHFTDRFSATGGLRYSSDDKAVETHNGKNFLNTLTPLTVLVGGNEPCALPAPGVFPGTTVASPGTTAANNNCQFNTAAKYSAISYTAGLEFKVSDDVLLYVKSSRGYRSGGLNTRQNTGTLILQSSTRPGTLATTEPFAKEVNDEQEIGLKTEFFDRRLRFNIAGFYNKVTNKQISSLLPVPGKTTLLTILSNANQRDYGVEADLAFKVTRDITLEANGAYLNAKLTKFLQPAALGSTVINDQTTDYVQYAPKTQFSVAANYVHDFGSVTVRSRVDYAWSASYFFTQASCQTYKTTPGCAVALAPEILAVEQAPSAGILGARFGLGFADGKYNIEVWGRNLTNERGRQSGLYVPSFGFAGFATRRDPASYGVTIGAKF